MKGRTEGDMGLYIWPAQDAALSESHSVTRGSGEI